LDEVGKTTSSGKCSLTILEINILEIDLLVGRYDSEFAASNLLMEVLC
jgi:hypothetical protein